MKEEQSKVETKEIEIENDAPKLDLSKIQNLEALGVVDRKGTNELKQKISNTKANKKKFCFLKPVESEIPSHGILYQDSEDEELKKGVIYMHQMSLADEEILTNPSYLKNGKAFRILFDSCMESDYDAGKILTFDANFLLFYLRSISYGDDYNMEVQCPECEAKFVSESKISEFIFDELPEDWQDYHEIKLPISNYTVVICTSRVMHDEKLSRAKKEKPDASPRVLDFIIRTIGVFDDGGKEVPQADWQEFYEAIPALDRDAITKEFAPVNKKVKTFITCPECGEVSEIVVPFTSDFFRFSGE